jgi:hypothetical protein
MTTKGYYGELLIGATEAALTHPCLVIYPDGIRWVDIETMRLGDSYAGFNEPWGARLKAISCSLVISTQVTRLGVRLYPICMSNPRALTFLPSENGVQGLLNRGMSWSGDVPALYGFGVATYDTLTATDLMIVSAIYEV